MLKGKVLGPLAFQNPFSAMILQFYLDLKFKFNCITSICDYGVAMVTYIIIKNFNVHTRLLIRGEQIHYKSIFDKN